MVQSGRHWIGLERRLAPLPKFLGRKLLALSAKGGGGFRGTGEPAPLGAIERAAAETGLPEYFFYPDEEFVEWLRSARQ
jgi:hypothetical protein